jgi:hypothetical protein
LYFMYILKMAITYWTVATLRRIQFGLDLFVNDFPSYRKFATFPK